MGIELLPESIRKIYEVHEWKHTCAILKNDFPSEWKDILDLLVNFRLCKSRITAGGGRKSAVAKVIDVFLNEQGWIEKEFATSVKVDEQIMNSPTHKVDCYKNHIALEVENCCRTNRAAS